jgi:hypothetical protein
MIPDDNFFRPSPIPFSQSKRDQTFRSPKQPYAVAVRKLAEVVPNLEVDFDHFGEVRSLSTIAPRGLYEKDPSTDPAVAAHHFLGSPVIHRIFGLRYVSLVPASVSSFLFGHRVNFKQVALLDDVDGEVPVRGGTISVLIDRSGAVFSVTSTLRRGRRPHQAGKIISPEQAIARAAEYFRLSVIASRCELMLSSHKGQMDPAYEVSLESRAPRDIASYLVLAKTGQVVDAQFKLLRCCSGYLRSNTAAKALLCTPNPAQPISSQVSRTVIERLPDPRVLKNKYMAMFLGHDAKPVLAKADGSYCYGTKDPEFAAVSVFIALSNQFDLYARLGMRLPQQVISVFVNDPTVRDNAYFDPINYELHIGVGSGLRRGGLNKHIAFDLGVSNHEFGHNAVFLQTPGNDLPGPEGAAMHEATGDVLGTLVMDYLSRIWSAERLGQPFTAQQVANDRRVIGKYVLPPDGIRVQRNTKRTPNDLSGEPHNDGLIAGGAFADMLVGMATLPETILEDQIRLFAKINLTALALVPMHRVSFKDMLRAFIMADSLETGGKHRQLIEMSFAAHGIMIGASVIWSASKESAEQAAIAA